MHKWFVKSRYLRFKFKSTVEKKRKQGLKVITGKFNDLKLLPNRQPVIPFVIIILVTGYRLSITTISKNHEDRQLVPKKFPGFLNPLTHFPGEVSSSAFE
jgi:hypothetical protein